MIDILAGDFIKVYATAIADEIGESFADFITYKLAGKIGYVGIVVAARDVMNLFLDSKKDLEQMYRIFCYGEMCEAYTNPTMLKLYVTDNQNYYSCHYFYVDGITSALKNIALLRILGEQEYFEYVKNDSFIVGPIEEHFSVLEELQKDIEQRLSVVKKCIESLNIQVFSNIKFTVKQE